ncbi:MAG TPA: TadE/TadG family type IV pilus assembly protein [Xanthobacteraceae bacterium]|nr:TadE/TadG family type IV pilus assembly protein [Xanthobacteraceae bacterium]
MKIADAFGHCRRSRAVSAFAHLAHSFSRRSDGTAAVEFAFVFVPFIVLLAAIIQTAFVFFATEALETATADAARLVMTGQTQGWTQDQFKAQVNLQVCPPGQLTGLFDCNKLYVDVQKKNSFSAMDSSLPPVVNGKYQTGFDSGSAGSIMLVRLIYQLPVYAFNLPFFDSSINFDLSNVGANHRVIVGTAAFCNEPFTGGTSVTGCSSGSSGT